VKKASSYPFLKENLPNSPITRLKIHQYLEKFKMMNFLLRLRRYGCQYKRRMERRWKQDN
jgi:hypothetical protein